jgi:hypothetical protein
MSGKNTALFGLYPIHGAADAAVDTLRGKGFLSTDISEPFPQNVGSTDAMSAPVTPPSAPRTPMPARAATTGLAAMTAPDQPAPTAPFADFLPNSWPNSGFRNSRRRGMGGG